MNDGFSKYKDLIGRIKATPKVDPPPDFTRRVMEKLPRQVDRTLPEGNPAGGKWNPAWAGASGDVNYKTCSFYYFVAGLFYMIVAGVALKGIAAVASGAAAIGWIGIQPYIAIGASILFFSLGILLWIDSRWGANAARFGTLFYIFATVLNSVMLRPYLHIPYATIFMTGLAATGAVMGIMLVRAVRKMELRTL